MPETEFATPQETLVSALNSLHTEDQMASLAIYQILDLLSPQQVEVTTTEKSALVATYTEGPSSQPISKDALQVLTLVNKALEPKHQPNLSSDNRIVYKTRIDGLTAVWETSYTNNIGEVAHKISLVRTPDVI